MARPNTQTELGGTVAVRPTAAPVRTITGNPQATVSTGGAAGLMSALAGVSPKLKQMLGEMDLEHQQAESERAYDTIQGMTFDEAQAAVKGGQMLATESPYYQAAFNKQFGMAYAAERRRAIVDAYNTSFDQDNGDLDEFLTQYAQNDFDAYGSNPHIMAGYREGMAGVFGKIKDQQAMFKSEQTQAQVADNFVSITRGAIDEANETGQDVMPIVRRLYTDHKKALGLSFAEMDDYVMQVAAEYAAAGDLATVEALMNHDVVAEDGTKVGSFSKRAKYSEKAAQLIGEAKANQGAALRSANTNAIVDLKVRAGAGLMDEKDRTQLETLKASGQITQAQHEAILKSNADSIVKGQAKAFEDNIKLEVGNAALDMIMDGRGWQIMDQEFVNPYTGASVSITAEELVEANVTDIMQTLEAKNATPAVMAQQLGSLGVDYKYPKWENAMNNGHFAITEALAKADANGHVELPERATIGYDLYKGLSDAPAVRNAHVQGEAEAIYRDAMVLEKIGWEPDEALLKSASIDRNGSRKSLSSAVDRDKFYSAVEKLTGRTGFLGVELIEGIANGQQVARDIEEIVRVQMDLGVPMDTAIKNGVEHWEQSHTVINGAAINTRDMWVPGNMDEASTALLTAFAEQTGDDVDDLTLMPAYDGSNYWVVAYKGNVALPADGTADIPNRYHITQIQQAAKDAAELAFSGSSMADVNATIASRSEFLKQQEENPAQPTRVTISPDVSANPLLAPINLGENR